jgi:hypothetical protein
MDFTINISEPDKTQAVVNSSTDLTPVADFELLVVGNRVSVVVRFCDSAGATPAFVTDGTTVVDLGLGIPAVDGSLDYATIAGLTVSGSTRVGSLDLDTAALQTAVYQATGCGNGNRLPQAPFTLEVRTITAAGLVQSRCLQRVYVSFRVLPLVLDSNPNPGHLAVLYDASTGLLVRPSAIPVLSGGVPAGGTINYVLSKASAADWDLAWVAQSGGGGGTWGSITGTLSAQTDLQAALDAKLAIGGDVSDLVNDAGYLTSAGAVTSLAGTANQIEASAATGAVTLSLPSDLIVPGTITVPHGGLKLVDSDASNALTINTNNITANLTLSLQLSGQNRSLTFQGNAIIDQDTTTNSTPTFTGINLGGPSVTDTTLTRSSAGNLAVEGNVVYRAGGTDVPVADGGTGSSTAAAARVALNVTTNAISALDIDWSLSGTHSKTLGANSTFTFSNMVDGETIVVALTNTASNYTVTWPTVQWSGGVAPVQTVGAKTDIYSFKRIGSTTYGSVIQNFS